MPMYEYRCAACGFEFAVELKPADGALKPACPGCQSQATQQIPPTLSDEDIQLITDYFSGGSCSISGLFT